jgi:hypothetical protein
MRKFLIISLLFVLCGCATMGMRTISKRTKIGMTEKQVYSIEGCPSQRSRQVINGKTYETWKYGDFLTLDFVDGTLTGEGMNGIYISQNGWEELKNLK